MLTPSQDFLLGFCPYSVFATNLQIREYFKQHSPSGTGALTFKLLNDFQKYHLP